MLAQETYVARMDREDFDFFRKKIGELAGINMTDAKLDLIQGRLRERLNKLGFKQFEEYRDYLSKISSTHEEWELFVNQLTTNKTDWFREPDHFEYLLEEFIPRWKKLGKKELKVWCAASSSGEEPYTLSLVLNHALAKTGIKYKIVASDIDTNMLAKARNGVYPLDRLYQIPENYHSQFMVGTGDIAHWMKVKKEIKEMVQFEQVNLTQPFPFKEKFDLIFCRNVFIYFTPKTIHGIVTRFMDVCEENAVLAISHSESLQNVKSEWKFSRPSVYVKGGIF